MIIEQKIKYKTTYTRKRNERDKAKRREYNKKYYAKTRKYNYSKWNEEMDKIVLQHHITDTEISELIGKSVMAIQVRRWRLKNHDR